MDVSELTTLAKALTKDEFIARFPNLFLLLDQPQEGASPLQFRTEIASPSARGSLVAGVLSVIPIVKAKESPYADRISIGRARNCDVVLRHGSVSKLHAHVRQEPDGSWVLIDLGSHNGTLVRGQKVVDNTPVPLKSADLITLGSLTVRVVNAESLHRLLLGMR